MSQENITTVLGATAAYNRGDLDTWSNYWTDDIDRRAAEGAPDDRTRSVARTPFALTFRTGSTRSTISGSSPSS